MHNVTELFFSKGGIIINIKDRIAEYGLNEAQYEAILKTCSDKINGDNDFDWKEIVDKYGLDIHYDTLRKASQTIFGGAFVKSYFDSKGYSPIDTAEIDNKIKELRKERMKLQTANIERNRLDRKEARQEMYYEQIGSACKTLPIPDFEPLSCSDNFESMSYVVTISDQHYGATFESENNAYSPAIFRERLSYLAGRLIQFVKHKAVPHITIVSLGDSLQGIIRLSDLAINDSSVVKAVVDYSRTIAQFLNELSYYVSISYYHVPTANHTQLRPLGTKASEIATEDMEYVIGNYIKDLLSNNERVTVNLADAGKQYIRIDSVTSCDVYAMHGHQIKNINNSVKDMCSLIRKNVDYMLLGHYHAGGENIVAEGSTYDCEVLLSPSFIGSDPYSDSLMKGSKGAVKIYGFDSVYGHTESYKIILN